MVQPIVPPFLPILVLAVFLPFIRRYIGYIVSLFSVFCVTLYIWFVPSGNHVSVLLFGFDAVLFNVDLVSRLMGLIFGFIGFIAILYSWGSDADLVQTSFALGYIGTSFGAVFGGDWLTLIFFWELMAVTSTLLVWYKGGYAVKAGFRYALMHGIGGSLFLAGIVWHYVEAGTFLFNGGIQGDIAILLSLIGVGVNVGFVGLHAWIPDTYPQPHIAASVFLCVYTTKTGVYGLYRIIPDGNLVVAYMGGAMAVFGVLMAVLQDDMRRLLSYHIQSQVGYMVAGVGIGGALATSGAFGHVFNHILYKSLLFMTIGVVIYSTGKERIKKLGGLGSKMPITAIAFFVGAFAISGFPGFNGFISKGMVVSAARKKHLDILWYLLLIGGIGTFLSFIKLGYYVFINGDYDGSVNDSNNRQKASMLIVAFLCILYGIYPQFLYNILPTSFSYHAYTVSHIFEVLVLAFIAVLGFITLRTPIKKIGQIPDIDKIYTPVLFYFTKIIVVGSSDLFAKVDSTVVLLVDKITKTVFNYERIVDVYYNDKLRVQTGIPSSVFLVIIVLIISLAIILFFG